MVKIFLSKSQLVQTDYIWKIPGKVLKMKNGTVLNKLIGELLRDVLYLGQE